MIVAGKSMKLDCSTASGSNVPIFLPSGLDNDRLGIMSVIEAHLDVIAVASASDLQDVAIEYRLSRNCASRVGGNLAKYAVLLLVWSAGVVERIGLSRCGSVAERQAP